MTQQQQEEVNLLKELIADTSISSDERGIYEDALSELMKSEKPKVTTERKPTTKKVTTQRKQQSPKQSKSDIDSAKSEIKRRTGKTEEECEAIVNEYRSLRAKSQERKKKEVQATEDNKDRVAKLKKDDKIISGTNEKTADAVIESTTKDVAEKIVKEIDKIEQKAEVEATKEVKKEMPKESTTEQNKAIAEKTEEKVKAETKTIVKRIVIDTSALLTSIAESLGKFDKDSQKEFLIKLRSDIDKLLTKYSGGGMTTTYNITQSNLSSSSVNPTMFNGGGGVGNGFMVFNYTDNLYASHDIFATKKEAHNFISQFKKRFEQQGYYRDGQMNKIDIEDLDLLVIKENFNPFRYKKGGNVNTGLSWHQDHKRHNQSEDYEMPLSSRKFNGGGGVDNPSKKEMLDYLNMYFDNYSELRTIAIEEDNILTRSMLNSLDNFELDMAYLDAKYEIKADTQ